jgi:membrane protease YdiL (CAAX protease family)
MRILKACGAMVGLFAISYVPAFAAVSILRPSNLNAAVPIILTISLLAASITLIIFLTRPTWVAADFGLAPCSSKHVLAALAVGAVSGMVVIVATRLSHPSTPFRMDAFSLWQIVLLFWVAASIQEELIFRGLLQSVVARVLCARSSFPLATILVALLFGAIHAPMGLVTVLLAFLLGLVTGYLRAQSRSLLPAIIVHAMFNIAGSIGSFI